MSWRPQKPTSGLLGRHELLSASRALAPITGSRNKSLHASGARDSLSGPLRSGPISRDMKHTSLRLQSQAIARDVSKSASFCHASTKKTRVEVNRSTKNLPSDQESFFLNLLLLGFDVDEVAAKHRGTSIPFDKDMFMVPNMLAFQVVMHFLFSKLDATKFIEDFRDCWPICDRKQEQMFRKVCLAWLTEISERNHDAHLPRLVPSLFLSPGGSRLYQLLLALSRFILTKLISEENGRRPPMKVQHPILTSKTIHMSDLLAWTMKELIGRRRAYYLSTIQQCIIVHNEWQQFAGDLVKDHRHLTKEKREKEILLEQLEKQMYIKQANQSPRRVQLSVLGLDQLSADRRRRIKQVRDDWGKISDYCKNANKEREVVTSIVKGTIDKHRVNAADFAVKVPDVLLKSCSRQIQMGKIGNTYEGGKLDLVSLLKLWNLSVEMCHSRAISDRPPRLEQFSTNLIGHVHVVTSYLANVRALRNKLSDVDIPNLRQSVASMRTALAENDVATPGKLWHDAREAFTFVPPSPPLSFESTHVDHSLVPNIKGKTPPTVGSTPEAAWRIVNAAKRRTRRRPLQDSTHTNTDLSVQTNKLTVEEQLVDSSTSGRPTVAQLRLLAAPSGGTNAAGRVLTPIRPRAANHLTNKKPPPKEPSARGVQPAVPIIKPSLGGARDVKPERGVPLTAKASRDMSKAFIPQRHQPIRTSEINFQKSSDKPSRGRLVSKELDFGRESINKNRAEDILIDRVVDAILSSTSPTPGGNLSADSTPGYDTTDVNLKDPLQALDAAVFDSRPILAFSPLSSPVAGHSTMVTPIVGLPLAGDAMSGQPASHRSPLLEIATPSPVNTLVVVSPSTSRIVRSPAPPISSLLTVASSVIKCTPHSVPVLPQPVLVVPHSVPVKVVEAMSSIDDVMDTSLELVDLESSISSLDTAKMEKEGESADLLSTQNLLGFVPRGPTPSCITPSCITPFKTHDSSLVLGRLSPGVSPSSSPYRSLESTPPASRYSPLTVDRQGDVLNSDEVIERLHQIEGCIDEEMLNFSLSVTRTPNYSNKGRSSGLAIGDYTNTSLLEGMLCEDDARGLPRTPLNRSRQDGDSDVSTKHTTESSRSPYCGVSVATPLRHLSLDRSPRHGGQGDGRQSPPNLVANYLDTTSLVVPAHSRSERVSGLQPVRKSPAPASNDIVSRFRSLKLRSQAYSKTGGTVVTPDENKGLDQVYLQASPKAREPKAAIVHSGRFTLDLHFDDILDSDVDIQDQDVNNNGVEEPHDASDNTEVYFKSPVRLLVPNMNISVDGVNYLDEEADDILVPDSPTGGASENNDLIDW